MLRPVLLTELFTRISPFHICQSFARRAEIGNFMSSHPYSTRNGVSRQNQTYHNFLVLDFEATCEQRKKIVPQEIIEFPCLQVDATTFQVIDTFHRYVKPEVNAVLSPFCVDLTGILQEMVDDELPFTSVLALFETWLLERNLLDPEKNIFVTCGDWDLQCMLPDQCQLSAVDIPPIMTSWINIKKSFGKATGHFPRGILDMLTRLNQPHVGRLHSGIDDCRNITTILETLGNDGFVFKKTGYLTS